jgi:hypothetical protein
MTVNRYLEFAARIGLKRMVVFEREGCVIQSGGVWCYSEPHLVAVLDTHRATLDRLGMEASCEAFVRAVACKWFEPDHELMPVILDAFRDPWLRR